MRKNRKQTWNLVLSVAALAVLAGCKTAEVSQPGPSQEIQSAPAPAPEAVTGFQPIQSELIYSVNYEQEREVLTVVLYEDGVYDYQEVPRATFDGLLKADDRDAYYRTQIEPVFKGVKFVMD